MRNTRIKDSLVVGFAMFAIFFGAGNLIFPPQIGLVSGEAFFAGMAGLILSGVLFPMMAVYALGNMGDKIEDVTRHVHPKLHIFFMVTGVMAVIFGTIPRCGSVAYESGLLGIFPELPSYSKWIFLIVFFLLSYLIASSRTTFIDNIGKYLTPFLLAALVIIIIMTVIDPIGRPVAPQVDNAFGNAFMTAINTGDIGTGLIVGGIFIATLKDKGYKPGKDLKKMLIRVIIVALIILGVVYCGLCYLGATGGDFFAANTDNTALLVGLIRRLSGYTGVVVLAVSIIFACFTTSAGMIATCADWIVSLSNGKLPYKPCAAVVAAAIMLVASTGATFVIALSSPLFMLLFSMMIVLTIMGTFKKLIPNDGAWKGACAAAIVVGVWQAWSTANASGLIAVQVPEAINSFFSMIPLVDAGFAWLVPSLVCGVVGAVIYKAMGKESIVDEIDKITEDEKKAVNA